MKILGEIMETHGGMNYWNTLEAVEADISASGFLFTAKRRPVLDHVRMRASTGEPRFTRAQRYQPVSLGFRKEILQYCRKVGYVIMQYEKGRRMEI